MIWHNVKAEMWRLKQELKNTKEELTQLKVRKKELEASGLCLMPVVTSRVSGQQSQGVAAEPGTPKKKTKGKQSPRDPLAHPHKRDRSTISHT